MRNWKCDELFISFQTTNRANHLNWTVTVKLCCWRLSVCQETLVHPTVMTNSKRGLFPKVVHSFICTQTKHTHTESLSVTHRLQSTKRPHHGDPSDGRDALAHSGEVVKKWRAAVLLTKVLHLVDQWGHRLQEIFQNILKRKKESFTCMVDFIKFTY